MAACADSCNSYAVRPKQGIASHSIDSCMPVEEYDAVFPFYSHSTEKFFLVSLQGERPIFTALAAGEAQNRGLESRMLSNLWKEDVKEGTWEMFPYKELVRFDQILKSQANTSEAIFQAMKQTKPWAVDFLIGNYMEDSKDVAAFGQKRGLEMRVDSKYVKILKSLGAKDADFTTIDNGILIPNTGVREDWDTISAKVMRGILYCKFNLLGIDGCGQIEASAKMRRLLTTLAPSTLFLETTNRCAVWGDNQGNGGKNLLGKLLTCVASCMQGQLTPENFLNGVVSEESVIEHVDYVRFNCTPSVVAFASCFPGDDASTMSDKPFLDILSDNQRKLSALQNANVSLQECTA